MWSKSLRSNVYMTVLSLDSRRATRGAICGRDPSSSIKPGAVALEARSRDEDGALGDHLHGVADVEERQAVLEDGHEGDTEEDPEDATAAPAERNTAQQYRR